MIGDFPLHREMSGQPERFTRYSSSEEQAKWDEPFPADRTSPGSDRTAAAMSSTTRGRSAIGDHGGHEAMPAVRVQNTRGTNHSDEGVGSDPFDPTPSSWNSSSMVVPNTLARRKARGRLGLYFPRSSAMTVCRETDSREARSSWDQPADLRDSAM